MSRTLLAAAMLLWAIPVYAEPGHPEPGEPHWYESDCCSMSDCRPARSGEVVYTGSGYLVTSVGVMVPDGDKRIKRSLAPDSDKRVHLCIPPSKVVRCIYIPAVEF